MALIICFIMSNKCLNFFHVLSGLALGFGRASCKTKSGGGVPKIDHIFNFSATICTKKNLNQVDVSKAPGLF